MATEPKRVDPQLAAEMLGALVTSSNSNGKAEPHKAPAAKMKLSWFCDIKTEEMDWFLYPWIPRKGLAGLAGPPKAGKSTKFIHWAAQLTRGEIGEEGPVKVLYLSKEDPLEVVKARLVAAKADMTMVGIVSMVHVTDDGIEYETPISTRDNLIQLGEILRDNPGIKVVFLDPANSFMGVNEGKDGNTGVQEALFRIQEFAHKNDVVIMLMKHFKKGQGVNVGIKDMVQGAGEWTQVCRAMAFLVPLTEKMRLAHEISMDDPSTALLLIGSNNYTAPDYPSRGIQIELIHGLVVEGVTYKYPVSVAYDHGERAVSVDDIDEKKSQTTTENTQQRVKNDDIKQALLELLLAAPGNALPREEITTALAKQGHECTAKTLLTKSKLLGVVSTVIPKTTNKALWTLPPEQVAALRDTIHPAGHGASPFDM